MYICCYDRLGLYNSTCLDYILLHNMSGTTDTGINMQVTNHLHIIHGMKNDANFLKIKMCIKIRNYVTLQKRCYKIE